MRLLRTVVLAGAALMAFNLSTASAAGLWVSYSGHDSFRFLFGAQLHGTNALNFNAWLSSSDDDAPNGVDLGAVYCVDLQGHVPSNPSEYYVETKSDGTGWADAFGRTNFGQVAYLINTYAPGALTRDQRNGLQVAVWESAYAGQFSYYDGLDADAYDAYLVYKAGAVGHRGDPPSLAWYDAGAATGGGQDMGHPVPEPASLLLLGAGLLGLGLVRSRKRS